MNLFAEIRSDSRLKALAAFLADGNGPVFAEGLWGSCAPILAAIVAERLERSLLLVCAHADDADDVRDDIETAIGRVPDLLPQLERLSGEGDGEDELFAERLRLCLSLTGQTRFADAGSSNDETHGRHGRATLRGGASSDGEMLPRVITTSILGLMQPVPSAAAIAARSIELSVGQTIGPEKLCEWLLDQGFARCEQVELPGDFAHRGGIVDVFSHGLSDPVRVEFFGDEIESIRLFDAGTQRSSQTVESIRVPALKAEAKPKARSADTTGFLSYLPADTIIAFVEPTDVQEIGRTIHQRMGERAGIVPVDAVFRRANDFTQLHLQRFAGGGERAINFNIGALPQFEPKSAEALDALAELTREAEAVVLCGNRAEKQRFDELLAERKPPIERVRSEVGVLHGGFCWRQAAGGWRTEITGGDAGATRSHVPTGGDQIAFIPHHELFRQVRQRRTLRRVQPARPIDTFFDLNSGDYVVHVTHGIGRFRGLESLERNGRRDEFLVIEFADSAVIHVPVSQIHVVQKYVGGSHGKPKLSKLGAAGWRRAKERVNEAVTDLAAELLALQASRATEEGVAYPRDTHWQLEFEGAFPFVETEDQLAAMDCIRGDLIRPQPMDRLICGDVGFGKTELAMRAAFKVAEYGKQVAVLVPTTVLAEQHYHTFRERMADYPFAVEVISRFRSKAEQSQIVEQARKGRIDVLIGTHRLLSKDVRFADLGLVVIDEEQRFGVEAKEKLKLLRSTVDVLTLSATPIPRTLHMALLGIRDISSLATPPIDRRAIVTQVRMWEDRLIRDAILRELARDGQVYFVHNFVRDIHSVADRIRQIAPEARVAVGHGQMKGHELEDVMTKFVKREADVLVSTNIIESGLDIPSANTIFINRAERFGLADLHQLRGRVGRSQRRAYCYLMLSPKHPVKDIAAKRLKAIEHYSDLGAGFQIAMRDLEIRGAGNILGPEQSGHIDAVGYEMYCQLLEQAVHRLKNEPGDLWRHVNLELGVTASIPRAYIRSERQRMEIYKRLAGAHTLDDVSTLRDDLRDAFGEFPDEVAKLLTLAEIRVLAQPWRIRSIVLDPPDVVFSIDDHAHVQPLFDDGVGSPRMPDANTIHWRLPKRRLAPELLLETLRTQLAKQPAGAGKDSLAADAVSV